MESYRLLLATATRAHSRVANRGILRIFLRALTSMAEGIPH